MVIQSFKYNLCIIRKGENMAWNMDSDRPIYLQIVEHITEDIINGHYAPGSKLESVRDLATSAGVNPNTMQKALSELERTGLIATQRTNGRTITENTSLIDEARICSANELTQPFCNKMKTLGYNKDSILKLVSDTFDKS